MITDDASKPLTNNSSLANPFLNDDVFPHFIAMAGDPIDAVRLADDARLLLEYVVACTVAQQIGAAAPELPELGSQFVHDFGAVAGQWLERCLNFAVKEAREATFTFEKLRTEAAARAQSNLGDWMDTLWSRQIFAAFARAAKARS